jgi:hypothetical protein
MQQLISVIRVKCGCMGHIIGWLDKCSVLNYMNACEHVNRLHLVRWKPKRAMSAPGHLKHNLASCFAFLCHFLGDEGDIA